MSIYYNLQRQLVLTAHDREAQDVLDKEQQLRREKTTLVKLNSDEETKTILLRCTVGHATGVLEDCLRCFRQGGALWQGQHLQQRRDPTLGRRGAGESDGKTMREFSNTEVRFKTEKVLQVSEVWAGADTGGGSGFTPSNARRDTMKKMANREAVQAASVCPSCWGTLGIETVH